MGTNFYLKGYTNSDDPECHLGKRRPAGYYCWDCGITLCKGGEDRIHYDDEWYDSCPECGNKPIEENLEESSTGRELGFNKSKPEVKKGVASCSSFTWARKLGKVRKIEDEYGRKYTRKEFEQILKECPIQYNHLLGQLFC